MSGPLPNLLSFVNSENEQFLISLTNDTNEMAFVGRLQALYETALTDIEVPEDDMPIFQLLTFTHYYFLTATAMLMQCHLSEAFGCARIAIDATLIGISDLGPRGAVEYSFAAKARGANPRALWCWRPDSLW